MYQLVTDQQDVASRELLADEELTRVLNLLLAHDNKLTLRDIKRNNLEAVDMDTQMTQWVDKGIILRRHGKYSVHCPIISSQAWEELVEKSEALFAAHHEFLKSYFLIDYEQMSEKVKVSHLLLACYEVNYAQDCDFICLELPPSSEVYLDYPTICQSISGKKTQWYSFEATNVKQLTLPTYFSELQLKKQPDTLAFKSIQQMIGDVNPVYFMTYVERKMRRLHKGKVISTKKPDIFLEALEKMNYVSQIGEAYQSNVVVFQQELYDQCQQFAKSLAKNTNSSLPKSLYLSILLNYLKKEGLLHKLPEVIYLIKDQ